MEKRTLIGILLVISGLALCAVSLWMLVDTLKIPFTGVSAGTTDSPKVGMAGGVIAVVVGIAFFVMNNVDTIKKIMLAVVFVSLILAVTTFALAIKERTDISRAEALMGLAGLQRQQQEFGFENRNFQNQELKSLLSIFDKLKTQLIVLIVVGVLASLSEIVSLVFIYQLQPSRTSPNAMQLQKPY